MGDGNQAPGLFTERGRSRQNSVQSVEEKYKLRTKAKFYRRLLETATARSLSKTEGIKPVLSNIPQISFPTRKGCSISTYCPKYNC